MVKHTIYKAQNIARHFLKINGSPEIESYQRLSGRLGYEKKFIAGDLTKNTYALSATVAVLRGRGEGGFELEFQSSTLVFVSRKDCLPQ